MANGASRAHAIAAIGSFPAITFLGGPIYAAARP